jgi:D-alanine transaminase
MSCVERAFRVAELAQAREALLTSTTSLVLPVVEVDGRPVGKGRPGPVGQRLLTLYARHGGLPSRVVPAIA